MAKGRIELTKKALHRSRVVEVVVERRLRQSGSGERFGLTSRQVMRLVAA